MRVKPHAGEPQVQLDKMTVGLSLYKSITTTSQISPSQASHRSSGFCFLFFLSCVCFQSMIPQPRPQARPLPQRGSNVGGSAAPARAVATGAIVPAPNWPEPAQTVSAGSDTLTQSVQAGVAARDRLKDAETISALQQQLKFWQEKKGDSQLEARLADALQDTRRLTDELAASLQKQQVRVA